MGNTTLEEEDENLVVVSDSNPEEKQKQFIKEEVNGLLLLGVMIGFGMCICLFGILQQFSDLVRTSELTRTFVRKFWFDLEWWYWVVPLIFLFLAYLWARAASYYRLVHKK